MENKKIPDRLHVDDKDRKIIQQFEDENYFNFNNKTKREQFLFAMAIGVNNSIEPIAINKKEAIFLAKDLKTEDYALMKACALSKTKKVDVLKDISEVFRYSELYAHTGFVILADMLKNSSFNSFEKKFEVELNELFDEIEF